MGARRCAYPLGEFMTGDSDVQLATIGMATILRARHFS